MIRRAAELRVDKKQHEQGGKGTVEIRQICSPEEMRHRARLCGVIHVDPGCSIGLHRHVDEDEYFYVIQGRALVMDGNVPEHLGPGDVHVLRDGESHSLENVGVDPLEVMAVILPA
jgi:mannose-6-phosphate isomerase-like protein (cupin superfamily)